jgi:hypothetical protein
MKPGMHRPQLSWLVWSYFNILSLPGIKPSNDYIESNIRDANVRTNINLSSRSPIHHSNLTDEQLSSKQQCFCLPVGTNIRWAVTAFYRSKLKEILSFSRISQWSQRGTNQSKRPSSMCQSKVSRGSILTK